MRFDHLTNRLWLRRIEEVPEGLLAEQRCTDDPQHIEGASVQPEVVLDDGDQAICDDGDIYLDADSILRRSPEGVDAEMRLYPFEETLDQPAVFIKESDGLGLEREVVGQERKRSFVLRGVVNDASESDGILAARLLSREPDGLVEDDITIVGKFFAGRNDLVLHPSLLADDELRRDEVNLVKSLKIIVSTVEDVVCEGFERNPVHSVDVRNLGISDIDIDRYLSRNVKKGMCFDARLRLPEIGTDPGDQESHKGCKQHRDQRKDQCEYYPEQIVYSTDNGKMARGLAKCIVDATYLINTALLKTHSGPGVTLTSKNWYGATDINLLWRQNAHNNVSQDKRNGKPAYKTFVDWMAHKNMGQKTLLFLIDGTYGSRDVNGAPNPKWMKEPFNGNWACSIIASQDEVACDAVAMDLIIKEWPEFGSLNYCDEYLREAASIPNAPSGTVYKQNGKALTEPLGLFEHCDSNGKYTKIDLKYKNIEKR